MPIQGQKFVIVGGAGLIGSALAHKLIEKHSANVVICDNFGAVKFGKWGNLPTQIDDIWTPENLSVNLDKSWREIAGVIVLTDGGHAQNDCDAIFHAAYHLPRLVWDYCVAKQRPMYWASSSQVYGTGQSQLSLNPAELANFQPVTAFGRAKLAFDMFAARQGTGPNTPPLWSGFRLSSIYGPGELHKGRFASLPFRAMESARTAGALALDASISRDWMHVEDCAAVMSALVTGAHAGFFDIGTGILTSGSQLASQVEAVTKKALVTTQLPNQNLDAFVSLPPANIAALADTGISVQFRNLAQGLTTL